MKLKNFIVLFAFALALSARPAKAAVIYSGSAYQNISVGQTFVVQWYMDTEQDILNTFSVVLNYSGEFLEPVSTGTADSLVSIWVENPAIFKEQNRVEMIGGIPHGVNAPKVPLFSVTFKAIKAGSAFINLDKASRIIRNDEGATEVDVKARPLIFAIAPADSSAEVAVSSPTHPDQQHWYTDNNVKILLALKNNEQYSYSFSSNLEIFPENAVMPNKSELQYKNLPDGIYYFKLNSKIDDKAWQERAVYRVQIDRTAPEILEPVITHTPGFSGGGYFLSMNVIDKISGLAEYSAKAGLTGSRIANFTQPLVLKRPLIGDTLEIKAKDNAGNISAVKIAYSGVISLKILLTLLLLILIVPAAYGLWRIRNKKAK